MQRAIRDAARTASTAPAVGTLIQASFGSVVPADGDVLARRVGFERSPLRMRAGVVGPLAALVAIVAVIGVVVSTLGHGSNDPPRAGAAERVTAVASFSASASAEPQPQPQPPALVVTGEPAASSVRPTLAVPSATLRGRGPSRPPLPPASAKSTAVLVPTAPPSPKPTAGDDVNPLDMRR